MLFIISFCLVFSQNKVTKAVADISVSGTKLHISYSDGTSKDMDMPPATSLRLPLYDYGEGDFKTKEVLKGYSDMTRVFYSDDNSSIGFLEGITHFNSGRTERIVFR